jgi:SprT protein
MDTATLRAKAIEQIRHYTELGNQRLNTDMPMPKVDFSVRGRVGGKYSPRTHTVMVNMVLFSENVEHYLEQTIPHEVAHGFQRHVYGQYRYGKRVMPHGTEWKNIMRVLGKRPDRCHSYDTSNASRHTVARSFPYKCDCSTYNLTIIRHRRAMKGIGYSCRKCGGSIRYVG